MLLVVVVVVVAVVVLLAVVVAPTARRGRCGSYRWPGYISRAGDGGGGKTVVARVGVC